jgi:hypothetical protein
MISPLPVQYAVPVEKKNVISDPMSPDQVLRSSRVPKEGYGSDVVCKKSEGISHIDHYVTDGSAFLAI